MLRIAFIAACPAASFLHPHELKPRARGPQHPATWVRLLAAGLARLPETHVHVFSDSRDVSSIRHASAEGFDLTFTPKREPIRTDPFHFFIPARLRLAPQIESFDPHVIVGFGAETGCGLLATQFNRPSVVFIQGILEYCAPFVSIPPPVMWLYRLLEGRLPRRAGALIAETEFARAWAIARNPRASVHVIPHPVAGRFLDIVPAYDAPRIICVGSLVPLKGVDVILRAFAECRTADARLVVAGDGPERTRLQQLAAGLGIAARVEFTGHLDAAALGRELQRARIFVTASRMDTSPNALTEAHAAGLPAVATRAGGIPEMVEDGHDGFLVDVDDHSAMASRLDQLLADPARSRAMGGAARAKVRALNDPGRVAAAWRHVLAGVAGRSGAAETMTETQETNVCPKNN